MPVPMLKTLAKEAGVSREKAERLWKAAKDKAREQGHGDDYAYIAGILKGMLGLKESGEGSGSFPDSAFLTELWGGDAARRLEEQVMPSGVRTSLLARYLEIEKQMRAMQTGKANMDILTRALRMAIYTLLNWLAKESGTTERFQKHVGVL